MGCLILFCPRLSEKSENETCRKMAGKGQDVVSLCQGLPGEHIEGLGCGLGPVTEFQWG